MSVHDAQQKAVQIDHAGRAVVATTNKEVAELYASRINGETNNGRHGLRTQVVPAS
jgi:ATP-dependent Clp protease adapter protein ClpS